MKRNLGLKLLMILIIVMVCLMSFVGIYKKDKGQVIGIVPKYKLGMNLAGTREVVLKVSDSTEEIIKDSEGNISQEGKDENGNLKEGYTKEDVKINKDEILTKENFEISKKIIENRLKKLGVSEFEIRQDIQNGTMTIELPENDNTDKIISNLPYAGKFEILDSETKEVLLDNSKVKEAKAVYNTTSYGTTVYLSIEFNKEGKSKLEEITKTYIQTTNENGEIETKQISINLDDEKLLDTHFDETVTTGFLQLSIGSATTSSETIQSYMEEASQVASLITKDKMEIKYELGSNTFLSSPIDNRLTIYASIIIIILAIIFLCVRYKANGAFESIAYVGFLSLLLLILRYANVVISLEGIAGLTVIMIANYMFIYYILDKIKENNDLTKDEIIKNAYIHYLWILLPLLVVSIVFTFIRWIPISSIGMTMFWGLIIMLIYNYITTKTLLEK